MASEERLRELEEKYEGYTVYDNRGSKIGKVDDLFVDEKDSEEYIGVKMGFFGMKSTLIPMEVVRINENDRTIEVSESKDHVKDAPSFDDDEDVTAEYEERIRSHFGLESLGTSGRGSYGASPSGASAGTAAGAAGSETTDRDEDRETGTSGYAPVDRDYDREGSSTTGEAPEGGQTTERGSSGETYTDDRETSSRETASSGGTFETGQETSSSAESGYGERREDSGAGYTGDREGYEGSGSSGTTEPSGEGTSGSQPSTSRQTEETETFQEGGRTKIRRRVIREEVVDADDQ